MRQTIELVMMMHECDRSVGIKVNKRGGGGTRHRSKYDHECVR